MDSGEIIKMADLIKEQEKTEKGSINPPSDREGLFSAAFKDTVNVIEDSPVNINEAKDLYKKIKSYLNTAFAETIKGEHRNIKIAKDVVQELVDKIVLDKDLFCMLVNKRYTDKSDLFDIYSHSVNVCVLVLNIGLEVGLDKTELLDLGTCALLHDIGTLNIPEEILAKNRLLDTDEYNLVKRHPIIGEEFLRNIPGITPLASKVALQEHERENGSGYPLGIKNDEIHFLAKIISITDTYEALTHSRPHRKQISPFQAVKILISLAGNFLFSTIVKAFINCMSAYPAGTVVKLNNDEVGLVVGTNRGYPTRPKVNIYIDAKGDTLKEVKSVNLLESTYLFIKEVIEDIGLSESFISLI